MTWYLGITSLCNIKGLFNSYVLLRLQQIPRFPSLSGSHTFSKIHMHTCIHVYVLVFTVPHTVVLKDQNPCFLSQRNRRWQHKLWWRWYSVLQTAEPRWASFCTADHGWHSWQLITVSQRKIFAKVLIPIKWRYSTFWSPWSATAACFSFHLVILCCECGSCQKTRCWLSTNFPRNCRLFCF